MLFLPAHRRGPRVRPSSHRRGGRLVPPRGTGAHFSWAAKKSAKRNGSGGFAALRTPHFCFYIRYDLTDWLSRAGSMGRQRAKLLRMRPAGCPQRPYGAVRRDAVV